MTLQLEALVVDAADPAALARFWAGVLGWTTAEDRPGAVTVVPSDPACVALRFRAAAAPSGASRHHLHVTSTSTDDMAATVERVLALGGRHLDVGQQPDEEHVVLADPEGNALCVIPPWNRFLAGTGRLGEVAGDGGRATGVFWSEALGWPLVWDEDDETAVQSPAGGTKVAFGGGPVAPKDGVSRTRMEVAAAEGTELADAVAELERLGALRVDAVLAEGDSVTLVDPSGTELVALPPR
ncbi:VOC family protein [Phycicoccus sp. MAQZ13P-2]|uniref:VOC family protein n=1 Tax=Phycicoccus mangrovi TaxID=2840470 RepID=UPI001C000E13|nr:VOC family protein [Phycicoccus mangrovi]MBT9254097.1 VOC family protein [Phycicoccus mangrovi]MBT9272477.1 VOC family protein [Phycicoccus mangrovi]